LGGEYCGEEGANCTVDGESKARGEAARIALLVGVESVVGKGDVAMRPGAEGTRMGLKEYSSSSSCIEFPRLRGTLSSSDSSLLLSMSPVSRCCSYEDEKMLFKEVDLIESGFFISELFLIEFFLDPDLRRDLSSLSFNLSLSLASLSFFMPLELFF